MERAMEVVVSAGVDGGSCNGGGGCVDAPPRVGMNASAVIVIDIKEVIDEIVGDSEAGGVAGPDIGEADASHVGRAALLAPWRG